MVRDFLLEDKYVVSCVWMLVDATNWEDSKTIFCVGDVVLLVLMKTKGTGMAPFLEKWEQNLK